MNTPPRGRFFAGRQFFGYILTVGLVLLTGTLFTIYSWRTAVDRHDRELATLVGMGAQGVNTQLLSVERALSTLADRLHTAASVPERQALLADFQKRYPEFALVTARDLQTGLLTTSRGGPPLPMDPGQMQSAQDIGLAVRAGTRMVISRPFYGSISRQWVILMGYGVRDAQGEVRQVIGAVMPLKYTHALWQSLPLPPGADMGLLRDDLYAVARHPLRPAVEESVFSKPVSGLLSNYLVQQGFPAEGLIRGSSAALGRDLTVRFQRLENFPLTFVMGNPMENLRWRWWALVWPTYLLMLLLLTGSVLIIRRVSQRQTAWQHEREERLKELEGLTQQLTQSNVALEDANAELAAFTYTVSHDLRAPIRAISGYASWIQAEHAQALQGEAGVLLGKIQSSAKRMWELLNDLLDLSRDGRQSLTPQMLDTTAEVRSVIEELAGNSPRTRFDIGALPPMLGDAVLMRQVWINLISNALKFSARSDTPEVRIGFEGGAFFVADNGAGFDMAYAHKLFKVFSRLHGEHDYLGTGVGLAIVKRIVERHGGTVGAEGKVGEGARFFFTVPQARVDVAATPTS